MNKLLLLILCLFPVNAKAVDYTGLVGCKAAYLFTEGSGTTVADSSGHGNTGTSLSSGHPAWSTVVPQFNLFSKPAGSILTDGLTDYINTGTGATIANLPAISIAVWIKPITDGENDLGRIIDKAGSTPSGWRFYTTDSTRIEFDVTYDAGVNLLTVESGILNTPITLNAWNYVVVTWDGTNQFTGVHMYINGVETNYDVQVNGGTSRDSDTATPMLIGNRIAQDRTFNGNISSALIFNRVITTQERTDIGNYGPLGLQSTLLGNAQINNYKRL